MKGEGYFIVKKTKCEACDGKGYVMPGANSVGAACPNFDPFGSGPRCQGGYIETQVDLLDVLVKLRFSLTVSDNQYLQALESIRIDETERGRE